MIFDVREMNAGDRAAWAEMRSALWPRDLPAEHLRSIDGILAGDDTWGFIAEAAEGAPAGFAELAIRNYANGCDSEPVPFLEGVFVKPQFRPRRAGARLMAHFEAFLAARGFHELGSDALADDPASHAAHRGWGFSETERVVYFRKVLDGEARQVAVRSPGFAALYPGRPCRRCSSLRPTARTRTASSRCACPSVPAY
jgi:aminoglycoside 6'-N-acetyltransferase I